MHILIQIRSWLMQTTVWKFFGFTSAVVGLVCYALSSSFNLLFGNWNLLKIFLYSVFCFIICLLILFAMIWNHSRRLRFPVQSAFLVLTFTSVYSFFSDRVKNGKPDTYSLISSAAFAIMSLSLSRQTQCGFEVDLLYFFLGCLIVQLMKIKWQLFIVGAGFSYSLIILRSSFPSIDTGPDNIQEETSVDIDFLSSQLASTDKITSSMIEQLRTRVNAIEDDNLHLHDIFLEHLKEYFDDVSELLLSEQNLDEVLMLDGISQETINNLQETIKLIVNVGFEKECSSVYSSCRREYLEEFLIKNLFDFEKFSIDNVNMIPWKKIKRPIKQWIKAWKVAIKILFPTERRLCDVVFIGFSDLADRSFTDVCKGSTIHLLNFANALANGSRSAPERLFRVLDVFETLRDLIPNFESLFCDEYSVTLRKEAILVLKKLGESIVAVFVKLENAIRQDQAKTAVSGGRLHPIVRYVMNYLKLICRYRKTLEQVFEDHDNHVDDDRVPSSSSLLVQIDRIMKVLESNLEAKAKVFNDSALSCVFLMNSSSYILQKIKNSELRDILADDTIQKHQAKIRHNYEQYQMSSWNKVMEFLKLDNNGIVPSNMIEKSMKEKLESFNLLFEEICRVQSTWFVLDEQLREDIRISIERNLLPAYGNFVGRFQSVMELGKNTDKYIKYATNDIEARLNDLFQGGSQKQN